jgi:hypothetical protein
MMPKPALLLKGFLNVVMLKISASAAGIMVMKMFLQLYYMQNFCQNTGCILPVL